MWLRLKGSVPFTVHASSTRKIQSLILVTKANRQFLCLGQFSISHLQWDVLFPWEMDYLCGLHKSSKVWGFIIRSYREKTNNRTLKEAPAHGTSSKMLFVVDLFFRIISCILGYSQTHWVPRITLKFLSSYPLLLSDQITVVYHNTHYALIFF